MTGHHRAIFGPHVLGPDGFRLAPHIGEFYTRMRIDGSQAKGDAVKAAAEAGAVASKSFGDRWKATFSKENLGKGLMQGLGLGFGLGAVGIAAKGVQVLTGAITGSFDAAVQWESALTGVSKTLDTTGLSSAEAADALAEIGDGLRDMAKEIPVPVEQLAALAEAGGALGIARTDLLEFTKTAAILGSTTDLAAEDAATALGKINAVLPLTRDEYSRFAATLVDLGNKGASTESEIVAMAQRMAGAAALVKMSKADLLGWASALSNVGEEAEAGGSSFQRFALGVNTAVAKGGKLLEEFASTAGMAADEFAALWEQDSSAALQRLVQELSKLDKGARQAAIAGLGFTDIRITRALLALTSNVDNLNGSLATGEQAWRDNTAATIEANKRFQTTESRMAILGNRLHHFAIQAGEVLVGVAELALDVADQFDNSNRAIDRGIEFINKYGEAVDGAAEAVEHLAEVQPDPRKLFDQAFTDYIDSNVDALQQETLALQSLSGAGAGVYDLRQWMEDLNRTLAYTADVGPEALGTLAQKVALLGGSYDDYVIAVQRLIHSDVDLVAIAERWRPAAVSISMTVDRFMEQWDRFSTLQDPGIAELLERNRDWILENFASLPGDVQAGLTQLGVVLSDGRNLVADALGGIGEGARAALDASAAYLSDWTGWYDIGTDFPFDLAAGVRKGVKDSEPELRGSIRDLRKKLRFDWDAEAVYAMGREFIRTVARGYNSGVPALEEDAKSASLGALVAMDRAGRTGPKAADRVGELLINLYARGMTRAEVEAKLAAEGVNLKSLEKVASKAGWWKGGWNVADAWIDGFLASMRAGISPITGILGTIQDLFDGKSPPPKGPLSHIDRGGYNVGTAWRDSFLEGIGLTPAMMSAAISPGLGGLGLSMPVSVSGQVSGSLGTVESRGTQVMEHRHTLSAEGAAALRSAGYDETEVAGVLLDAWRTADRGYDTAWGG